MRAFAAALGLALATATLAASLDVARLMELLRASRPARATFHETRHLAILDRPVESTGVLEFTPPGRLEKRTTGLNAERVVADGDSLAVERNGRRQVFALRDHPQVAVLIEGLRGTLAGDRAALEKVYRLRVEGREERWTLTLEPRDAALTRVVRRIVVGGFGAQVRRVEIEQGDGDRSVMVVTPVAP